MQISVAIEILFELLSKRKVTAPYLAETHNLSVRTVYRYIDALSLTVPLQVERGRNGGIFISDTYKLPVGFMTKEEYSSIIEALNVMYVQLPEERFLSAKRKLSAQMKTETRDLALSSTIGNILVDGGTWGDSNLFSDKLKLLENSVRDHYVLDITYTSREGEKTRRKIEPHVLIFKQGIWYTYAFCRKKREFRLFRLSRIDAVIATEESFIRRPFRREDIPLNFWTNDENSVDVSLEISEAAFADVQDWLGSENLHQENGKWYARMRLPDTDALIGKLLGFGNSVKILSPENLRIRVREEAEKILALYS